MLFQENGDRIYRQIFHNIRGSHDNNFEVTYEIAVTNNLGSKMAGYQEINKPLMTASKHTYDLFIDNVFEETQTVYASVPIEHICLHHPWGCFLVVNIKLIESIQEQGSNIMC